MLNIRNLKVLRNLSIIIIIFISCMMLINNRNMLIDKLSIRALVIKSGSMIPTFNKNDIIIIKKAKEYKVGDIITYNQNEYFITHRIVAIENKDFITKGDNNNCQDEQAVSIENIKGKVILILNKKHICLGALFLILIFASSYIIRKGKKK